MEKYTLLLKKEQVYPNTTIYSRVYNNEEELSRIYNSLEELDIFENNGVYYFDDPSKKSYTSIKVQKNDFPSPFNPRGLVELALLVNTAFREEISEEVLNMLKREKFEKRGEYRNQEIGEVYCLLGRMRSYKRVRIKLPKK